MDKIVYMEFGSHLYGTDTPESDRDYKGIYLPSIEDCILGKVKKSITLNEKVSSGLKNTKEDIDIEFYSLQYFIKLALQNETVAIDMLHCPKPLVTCGLWENIRKNRHLFYTKNMSAYIGYVKRQAAKYGIKGSRLNSANKINNILTKYREDFCDTEIKLRDIGIHEFENIEHVELVKLEGSPENDCNNYTHLLVCGKYLDMNAQLKHLIPQVQAFIKQYGERAKKAALNEGIDWKAISHAFRASYQLIEIYLTGNLSYPLFHAEFLTDLKQGKYHYQKDGIGEKLEELVDKIETLSKMTEYPEKADKSFWEKFILNCYQKSDIPFNTYMEKVYCETCGAELNHHTMGAKVCTCK